MQVIDHYENPRNVGALDKSDKSVGTGLVGAPACGDVMKLQVRHALMMMGPNDLNIMGMSVMRLAVYSSNGYQIRSL